MKIRLDFVTNSSSSSFVTFGIYSQELREFLLDLIACGYSVKEPSFSGGMVDGDSVGEELDLWRDVINITRDINTMDVIPNHLDIYSHEEGYEFPESSQIKDAKKMLWPKYAIDAIKGFFSDLPEEDNRELYDLVHSAFRNNNAACKVYEDFTDGFTGELISKEDIIKQGGGITPGDGFKKEKKRGIRDKEQFLRRVERYNENKEEHARNNTEKWMNEYGYLIDHLDYIDLNGKNVVVSGGNPIYEVLELLGATVRWKTVSGNTDYLFIDPCNSGYSKVVKAGELRKRGNTNVKVVSAENLFELIKSGQYYSTEMALEDEKREAEELKNNKLGYGLLLTMMTCLKAIPVNAIDSKERLPLESLLISDKMESILGTNLKEVLQYYQADSTAMALQCMKYIKENADLAEVHAMIDRIRDEFGEDNTVLITILDIVASMIKEA